MRILTVTPLCPPMTGTLTAVETDKSPIFSATNVDARTTSSVVTPNNLIAEVNKDVGFHESHGDILLGVKDLMLLEDLSDNWDSRVYGVRDDKNECLGRCGCNRDCEVTNDASVDLDPGYQTEILTKR